MISSQFKNVNIANFVLAVSSQVEKPFANCHLILHLVTYKDSNNEENSIFMGIQS